MALNDILTSMDGARDALVTAINAKGGSLADNATFYQCADAVGSLSGGTSAEYYKCASVSAEAATPEGATFTMQLTLKALSITSTYHWVMDDTSKTGTERTWTGTVKGDSGTHTLHFNGTYWQVVDGLGNTTATETADDPWDITNWHNADGGDVSCTFSDVSSASTGSKTWSGYKAVWGDNGYTISDDLTEGLVYSGMTPQVGTIYDSTCSVRVAALYSSLAVEPELPVFYAPLMTDTSIEINPSSMTTGSGNVSFSTVDGVPTAVLDSGFLLWDKDSTLPNGNHEISISFGLRLTQTMENKLIFFYGSNDGYNGLGLQVNGTSITMSTKEGNNLIGDTQELQLDTWYHILVTYTTDGMWKLYINGTLKTSASKSLTLSRSYSFNFGCYTWSNSWRNLYACITRARIYDYAIDDTYNIAWLMQEIGVS